MAEFETTFADPGAEGSYPEALTDLGYEKPFSQSVQSAFRICWRDVLGMAQTETAVASSLPLLNNLDPELKGTRFGKLAPTRELAVQVAAAMTDF